MSTKTHPNASSNLETGDANESSDGSSANTGLNLRSTRDVAMRKSRRSFFNGNKLQRQWTDGPVRKSEATVNESKTGDSPAKQSGNLVATKKGIRKKFAI